MPQNSFGFPREDRPERTGPQEPQGERPGQLETITGTAGNNSLTALPEGSRLFGLDGDDVLLGGAGDDVIIGGDGDDLVGGAAGNDRVDGGQGSDLVFGTGGDDTLTGGAGNDVLAGGLDNDTISGGIGGDVFYFRFMSSETGAMAVDGQDALRDFTNGETLLLDDLANGSRAQQPLDLSTTVAATDALGISVTDAGNSTVLGFAGGSIRLDGVSGYDSLGALQAAGYNIVVG